MNENMFKKAERTAVFLKLAMTGSAGSGKTLSALRLARGLVGPNGRIAVIDTENGSASLYADRTGFDVCNVEDKSDWEAYSEMVKGAEQAGYDCIIIDSFSHVWEAILDYKAKLDAGPRGNSYTNWNDAGRKFKEALEAILHSRTHVICCLRTKTEYVLEKNDNGKSVPRKIGLAPIMREGIEFEFTTVFDISVDTHTAICSKDRTGLFTGKDFLITEQTGVDLDIWRKSGKPMEPVKTKTLAERIAEIIKAFAEFGVTEAMIENRLGHTTGKIIIEEFEELRHAYKELRDKKTTLADWKKSKRNAIAAPAAPAGPSDDLTPATDTAVPPTTAKPAETTEPNPEDDGL